MVVVMLVVKVVILAVVAAKPIKIECRRGAL